MAVWCDKSAGKYSEENGDQMRRGKWIIFGMLVALLAGCSGKKTAEEAQKNSEIQTEENSTKVNLSKENTADTATE